MLAPYRYGANAKVVPSCPMVGLTGSRRENTAQLPPPTDRGQIAPRMNGVAIAPFYSCIVICVASYWRIVVASKQWVVTVVAEGDDNPFDIVSDFLEDLKVRGHYTIVSTAITPASGICGTSANDHDYSTPTHSNNDHDYVEPTFGEILERIDGHDHAVYAGISVSRGVR